jgi:excisionase family DNA binding protein
MVESSSDEGRSGVIGSISIDLDLLASRIADLILMRTEQRDRAPASPWMGVEMAASYLDCSPERIRKLVARRAIPFHQERPGARVFLHRGEIDEWLLSL